MLPFSKYIELQLLSWSLVIFKHILEQNWIAACHEYLSTGSTFPYFGFLPNMCNKSVACLNLFLLYTTTN